MAAPSLSAPASGLAGPSRPCPCGARRPPPGRHSLHQRGRPGASCQAAQALQSLAELAPALQHPQQLALLADLDPKTAGVLANILRPLFAVSTLLFLVRIVGTWYPQIDGDKLPWAIAYKPTEPVLGPTRRALPPVGGVDISPIVWLAVVTLSNEILVGPQGILYLLQRKLEL